MATLIEKAAEILARCETVVITSINQEGYPPPRSNEQHQVGRGHNRMVGDRQRQS